MAFDSFISVFIQTGFVLLFMLTAFHKLRDLSAFRKIVTGYNIVPPKAVGLVSFTLPFVELLSVGLLLWKPVYGLSAVGGLLGIYGLPDNWSRLSFC